MIHRIQLREVAPCKEAISTTYLLGFFQPQSDSTVSSSCVFNQGLRHDARGQDLHSFVYLPEYDH